MLSDNTEKFIVTIICCIGFIIRFQVIQSNPPNNSYDDHIEAIEIYCQEHTPPSHSTCWECYQPPLYYTISAGIIRHFPSTENSWKLIQYLNLLLFLGNISLITLHLIKSDLSSASKILLLSIYATLPRDIYTCAMIGNDYLLCFIVCTAAYFYSKLQSQNLRQNKNLNFCILCTFCLLGVSTKQHGLLIYAYPLIYTVKDFIQKRRVSTQFIASLTCLICTWIAITTINMSKTGHFMISNQNYYDYAENQPPGTIDSINFFTFELTELWKNPHMNESTLNSFGTEIFARIFFDYEPKFTHESCIGFMEIAPYTFFFGLLWTLCLLGILALKCRSLILKGIPKDRLPIHTIVTALFFMVPLLQTLRYPYFSSMKAMFLLPGIYTLFFSLTQCKVPFFKFERLKLLLALCTLIFYFCFFHTGLTCTSQCVAENLLPLWLLPSP
jgi:hypothetical protein